MRVIHLKRFEAVRLRAFGDTVIVTLAWNTPSGALTDASTTAPYSATLLATASNGAQVFYSIIAGALPAGLSMNSSGVISGTASTVTTENFTVRATIGTVSADRVFSISSYGPPEWVTPSGRLGVLSQDETFVYTVLAE